MSARRISLITMIQCLRDCGKPEPASQDYDTVRRAFDAAFGGFMTGSFRRTYRPVTTATYTSITPKAKKSKIKKHGRSSRVIRDEVVHKKIHELTDAEFRMLFADEPTDDDLRGIENGDW